jgi:acyl-CoA thioesterase I
MRTLLALFILALSALGQTPRPAARTVLVFGDSLTAGNALPKEQREKAWVRLVERDAGGAFTLINQGKGGRPTQSLDEFAAVLNRQPRPDILVIALGTNDSRDITEACVPKAVANLRSMIASARAKYSPAPAILLVGPPNINKAALVATKPIANEREAQLRALGSAFRQLADETGCAFVNLFGVLPEATLTADGVHPDPAGNAAIAARMLEALRRVP